MKLFYQFCSILVLLSQWEHLLHKIKESIEKTAVFDKLRLDISNFRRDMLMMMESTDVLGESNSNVDLADKLKKYKVRSAQNSIFILAMNFRKLQI